MKKGDYVVTTLNIVSALTSLILVLTLLFCPVSAFADSDADFYYIWAADETSEYDLSFDGTTYTVTPEINEDGLVAIVFEDSDTVSVSVPKGAEEYVLAPKDGSCDYMFELGDCIMELECEKADSVTFRQDYSFDIAGAEGEYGISIKLNEGFNKTPWFETRFQGVADGDDISIVQAEDGILVSGANNDLIVVTAVYMTDDFELKSYETAYRTDRETVLITAAPGEEDEIPVVKVASGEDGVFDAVISGDVIGPILEDYLFFGEKQNGNGQNGEVVEKHFSLIVKNVDMMINSTTTAYLDGDISGEVRVWSGDESVATVSPYQNADGHYLITCVGKGTVSIYGECENYDEIAEVVITVHDSNN